MKDKNLQINLTAVGKKQNEIIEKTLKIIKKHKILSQIIEENAISDDEIIDNIVDFLNLKDSLDFPQVYPWIFNISRKNGVLVFKKIVAKNNFSKNVTRSVNLLYTQINNPNSECKLSKVRQTTLTRKELIAKIKILKDFLEKKKPINEIKSIYVYGERESGKSYIACAAANSFSSKGISTVYLKPRDLFTFLTKQLSLKNGSFESTINDLKKVSLLIIDDFGTEKSNDWFKYEVLTEILKYRNERGKLTMIFSQFDMKTLKNYYLYQAKNEVDKIKTETLLYECFYKKDEFCINSDFDN